MSHALSLDLRRRVVAAAEAGQSHRAIVRREGEPRAKALGGDRRSGAVERAGPTILAIVEQAPDITIEELRVELAGAGLSFGFGTIRRFFARPAVTRKKRPRTPASRTGRTS